MRKYIRLISVIVAVLMAFSVFSALPAFAGTAQVSGNSIGFRYNLLTDGTAEIIGYDVPSTKLVVPSQIDGYTVTSIGNNAFKSNETIKSAVIPDTVTNIGEYAFYFCKSLVNLTIPESVTNIGDNAFYWCESLESVKIPDSVITIGESAFASCTGLKDVTIGNNVTSIGSAAFYYCISLKTITIPDSVTALGNCAFQSCDSLINAKIGNGITHIDFQTFSGCKNLFKVTIGNNVKSIGSSAFGGCTSLSDIHLPDSVTALEDYVFSNCRNLISITIPNSIESVGPSTFSGTAWYDNQPDGVVYVGNIAYKYKGVMDESAVIELRAGTVGITDEAFGNCENMREIKIPDSVQYIGEGAFYCCTGLEAVDFGNGIKSIGREAFMWCVNLSDIAIPDSVTKIGKDAFGNTLWYINQPDGIVYAGKGIYSYKGIMPENITLKDGITFLAEEALLECSLNSITIPKSVVNVDNMSIGFYFDEFYDCYFKSVSIIINGYAGTDAERYANKLGFKFVDISNGIPGDVSGDGELSVTDVTDIQRYVAKSVDFTPQQLSVADYNSDGVININDATAVQYALVSSQSY